METYYNPDDLAKFSTMGEFAPDLWEKFMAYYGSVFEAGALTKREKALIALAVAHAVQCPYCIDAYTQSCLENGANEEQMTEAVHVACALRGGASLVHGVQMKNVAKGAVNVIQPFENMIDDPALAMTEEKLSVLQVNLGRLCNLSCKHCHIEAGPNRKEIMTRETMQHVLRVLPNFATLDITGGAPEMNPDFRWLVDESAKICPHIMVRSNLVIMTEKGYEDIPKFLADRNIEIVCSLPYYSEYDCDRQRGKGTFKAVISMLKKLNALGYGIDEKLPLDLVYNPGGAFLPPNQNELEQEYKSRIDSEHGIKFTRLFAITNNPIGRFGEFLRRTGNYDRYMNRLYEAFNPSALAVMMCRFQLSVGWDGRLYDCDFNQPLNMTINGPENISGLNEIHSRKIRFGNHCYACTAGSGSSCGGATAQ